MNVLKLCIPLFGTQSHDIWNKITEITNNSSPMHGVWQGHIKIMHAMGRI